MKNTRKLALLLAWALTLAVAASGCGGSGGEAPGSGGGGDVEGGEFQKNMHQTTALRLRNVCETDDGVYFTAGSYVHYLDKAEKRETILCAKPECAHDDETCNARLYTQSMWYDGGKLYFNNSSSVEENGRMVDYGDRVYSVEHDGTGRRAVQELEFTPDGDKAHCASPIMHRGMVYFSYNGVLYSVPLGGDIDDAERIWGDEIQESGETYMGMPIIDPNALHYDLWADGDRIYIMANMPQPNGTYKDTLYYYDTVTKESGMAWQTPDADTVGQWESTGVAVSAWYVIDGYIYFYLSGGDMWRSDLETGETEKLADTHERTKSGTAIFSDDFMCLLNDEVQNLGLFDPSDFTGRIGGDTFYIYTLDGTLVNELPLGELYDKYDELFHIQPAFCTGRDLYFVANTVSSGYTTDTQGIFTGINREYGFILCCVNIDTGEITEIYSWD